MLFSATFRTGAFCLSGFVAGCQGASFTSPAGGGTANQSANSSGTVAAPAAMQTAYDSGSTASPLGSVATGTISSSSGAGSTGLGNVTSASQGAAVCTAAGITQAQLLTPSITNGDPNSYLSYQISLANCAGQAQLLTAAKIQFFCGAAVKTATSELPSTPFTYTVTDGTHSISGNLPFVKSTSAALNYGVVNETDQPVSFATAQSSVTFTVYEHGVSVTPTTGNAHVLDCFLAYGAAAPVHNQVQLIGN